MILLITRNKFLWITIGLLVFSFAMSFINLEDRAQAFHSLEEKEYFALRSSMGLPLGGNALFKGSGECAGCHGPDAQGFASVDANGVDVNVTSDWRSTMMANSAKDPFWRAKVSHEVLVNPAHQVALEDKCTSCHAPQGHYNAKFLGNPHYSIAEMVGDSIAMDGVACNSCHQQSPDSIGLLFSGNLKYETEYLYGQYDSPPPIFASPMLAWVNFEPRYGAHVEQGEFCAGCHTLITETADLSGNPTGNQFVEQATYHEWVNSIYNETANCQSCHIPRIDDPVVISSGYSFLEGRSPFGLHHMVGGNSFMLKMLKNNITDLGIAATETHFDSTIARTERLLQNHTLDLTLTETARDADTAYYHLSLLNKAGHKFPSGYPARLAFIEFVVTTATNDTLFASGLLDEDFNIVNRDVDYERHYDIITNESQVQIYEMVMGDVNGDPTTVLERADYPLKDNRLVPVGFSSSHYTYDTVLVAGLALEDLNFNALGGVEGSGTDEIRYHVSTNGYNGLLNVSAKVFYQSVPRKWLDEMFEYNSPEIDLFRDLFEEADHTPVLIAVETMQSTPTGISPNREVTPLFAYPSPTTNGLVTIDMPESDLMQVMLFDVSGKMLYNEQLIVNRKFQVVLPEQKGLYLIRIESPKATYTTRVVRQ
jgi:hypothetical protein